MIPGQLIAVVGPVGCGKSSLLSALLGEMITRRGYANLNVRKCQTHFQSSERQSHKYLTLSFDWDLEDALLNANVTWVFKETLRSKLILLRG